MTGWKQLIINFIVLIDGKIVWLSKENDPMSAKLLTMD